LKYFILVVLITSISHLAHTQTSTKPLFIKAKCDGKLSSPIVPALKDAARASQKYDLVDSLDDNGRLDTVQTIYLTCVENRGVTAIATQFGIAKCQSPTVCHSVIDGLSLNAALCPASRSPDCGRALFKVFDAYINRPNPTPLKVD
jgi:hypothetical protein